MAESADKLYRCEYAKSGRASCKKCKNLITKESLRLAIMVQSPMFDGKVPHWHHYACFWKRARVLSHTDIDGFTELRWEDQEKIKKVIESGGAIADTGGESNEVQGSMTLNDFAAEYAKSNRSTCKGCDERIEKGQVRLSKKSVDVERPQLGMIDRWYHPDCFVSRREELGFLLMFSASQLKGFKTLKDEDRDTLQSKLPAIKTEAGGESDLSEPSVHRDNRKMSAVWKYFKINADKPQIADCKLCSAKLSRGGTKASSYNTSNLIKHLKVKHKSEHWEFTAAAAASSSSSSVAQQPTLQQTSANREKLSRDNPRAVTITEALTRFIILDDQPLSIVENTGFHRFLTVLEPKFDIPSSSYITDFLLPQMHDTVKQRITVMLQEDIKAFSFTTDTWSSSVSPLSLISLTAQWIDGEFSLHQVLLLAKKFEGSLTGQAIASILEEMLQTWGIPKSSVHVVVRENAKNMIKGTCDAGLPSISCVAHTLQLAVSEGLLSLRSISEAVGVGRRLVGHFKHCNLAYSQLHDIQMQLGQPVKRLQHDVQTRWNSTFYMLQSLIEQKRAIGVYASEHELPAIITAYQWNLMEKVLNVLAPFEEMTRHVSCSDAFASDVIPAVTVLQRMLSKVDEDDDAIKTMKSILLAALQKRFSDTEQNPLYCVATFLDPRYKDRFFTNADTSRRAKETFLLELQNLSEDSIVVVKVEDEEPAAKRPHRDQPGTSLDSVFAEIAGECPSTSESRAPKAATIQLEAYLGEITVPRSDKPLKYWAVNKRRFPSLAKVAQKYLSAPCSSVESERLFGSASSVLTDSRHRLMAEHAEILLFLKKNLPLTFDK